GHTGGDPADARLPGLRAYLHHRVRHGRLPPARAGPTDAPPVPRGAPAGVLLPLERARDHEHDVHQAPPLPRPADRSPTAVSSFLVHLAQRAAGLSPAPVQPPWQPAFAPSIGAGAE